MRARGSWLLGFLATAAFVALGFIALRRPPEFTLGLMIPGPDAALSWPGFLAAVEERGFQAGVFRIRPVDASAHLAANLAGDLSNVHDCPKRWVDAFDQGAPAPAWIVDGAWRAGMRVDRESLAIAAWLRRERIRSLRALDEVEQANFSATWEGSRKVTPLWFGLRFDTQFVDLRFLRPGERGTADVALLSHPDRVLEHLSRRPSGTLLLSAACVIPESLARAEGAVVLLETLKPPPRFDHPHAWAAWKHTLETLDLIATESELGGSSFTLGNLDVLEPLRSAEVAVYRVRSGRLMRESTLTVPQDR